MSAPRFRRTGVVVGAVLAAVLLNLLVRGLGALAGGTFDFTSAAGPAHVDPLTVVGFTAVPLAVGLTLATVLSRWWAWVLPVALVVAPVLALATIPAMTLPADLDAASTAALAAAHVVVGAVAVLGVLALRSWAPAPRAVLG